jgi:hypothetical protein
MKYGRKETTKMKQGSREGRMEGRKQGRKEDEGKMMKDR